MKSLKEEMIDFDTHEEEEQITTDKSKEDRVEDTSDKKDADYKKKWYSGTRASAPHSGDPQYGTPYGGSQAKGVAESRTGSLRALLEQDDAEGVDAWKKSGEETGGMDVGMDPGDDDGGDMDEACKPELDEESPEGWEGTVKAMKDEEEIDNPWALAHWMKGKGYESHKEGVDLTKDKNTLEHLFEDVDTYGQLASGKPSDLAKVSLEDARKDVAKYAHEIASNIERMYVGNLDEPWKRNKKEERLHKQRIANIYQLLEKISKKIQ